jgi:hypothetical protein
MFNITLPALHCTALTHSLTHLCLVPLCTYRCIPSGANLFKDTDHPFRWFLAPYVNIYIFVCDTMESYKGRKAKLKQWIDALSGPKRSSWLVVYLPMGKQSHDSYQKIYSKLSSEIYFDKVGDRTSVVYCNSSHATRQACAAEVIDKIKDGIIISFYQRYVCLLQSFLFTYV